MELVKLVRVVIFIINPGSKSSHGILFADNMANDIRIYVI